jgi:hypothetical protein
MYLKSDIGRGSGAVKRVEPSMAVLSLFLNHSLSCSDYLLKIRKGKLNIAQDGQVPNTRAV